MTHTHPPEKPATAARLDPWFSPWRFAALLGLLLCAMFPEVVLGQHCFFYRDFQLFAYPWAEYHRTSLWRGELPLWNPLSNCGLPFLAQWNTLVLYPPSLLYVVLPLAWGLSVFCLGHLLLGGVGMFLLARRWTGEGWPAALAGLAYAFSGLTLNSLTWTNNIAALGWMPWVVRLAEDAWEDGGRSLVKAALAGALQMLAGAPEIIALTWALVGVLGLRAWATAGTARWRTAGRLALLVGWVACLCAIQLGPFLELLAHSQRDRHYGAALWPMPPWGAANFLVPLFFSFPWSQGVFFQYDQYWTSSYYVGIATITLALAGLAGRRQPRVWVLTAVLMVSLLLAMGDAAWLYGKLKDVFPFLGIMRYPIKFVVLAVFILPLLAALGASASAPPSPAARRPWRHGFFWCAATVLVLVAGILWYARFHPRYAPPYDQWPATWENGWARALFLAAFAAGFLWLPRLRRTRGATLLQLGLLLGVWLDAYTHAPRQNPTLPAWIYEPTEGLHRWSAAPVEGISRAMPSPAAELALHESTLEDPAKDYLRKRAGLYSNCNLVDRVPKVNGVFSLHLREAEQVSQLLYGSTQSSFPALMDFLGVTQVTAPGSTLDWLARTNAMPLLSSGQRPVFTNDCREWLQQEGFNPRQVVALPPNAAAAVRATNGTPATLSNVRPGRHRIECDTDAAGPALVVVAQSFYPAWQARVDGQPVPLWRANHAFQAVEVPAGKHRLQFVYRDQFFRFGALISGLSLLACAVAWRQARRA